MPILTIFALGLVSSVTGNPHSTLHYFETLQSHHVSVQERVPTDENGPFGIIATFRAFQQVFSMHLRPGSRVLHPDAEVKLMDSKAHSTTHKVDHSNFYSGTLNGNLDYDVHASLVDGVWIAHIHTPDEFFAIEPLHFFDDKATHTDMIVYRGKDIIHKNHSDSKPFCGVDDQPGEYRWENQQPSDPATQTWKQDYYPKNHHLNNSKLRFTSYANRFKRQTPGGKRKPQATECSLIAVVGYGFYKGVGKKNTPTIVRTLVHVYENVNQIFRSTNFGGRFNGGYGIIVKAIIIHTEYSDEADHYNTWDQTKTIKQLLHHMTHNHMFENYCLSHATMQRDFGPNLGMATHALTTKTPWENGICASLHSGSRNMGVSTIVDSGQQVLTFKMYSLVVAHEIGHNWGAFHDPWEGPRMGLCSPSSDKGGRYLMWKYFTRGLGPNSNVFSPCSKESITQVLKIRAHLCFKRKDVYRKLCGNGIVDDWEECDPGIIHSQTDPCCDRKCRLKPGAQCAFSSEPCCTRSCQVAPSTQECNKNGAMIPCYHASKCLGNSSKTCPEPVQLPNDTPCQFGGKCKYGRCASYCEVLGTSPNTFAQLEPCMCEGNLKDMCMQCCRNVGVIDSKCEVMGPSLRDGAPCLYGSCEAGICKTPTPGPSMDVLPHSYRATESNRSYRLVGSVFECIIPSLLLMAVHVYCWFTHIFM